MSVDPRRNASKEAKAIGVGVKQANKETAKFLQAMSEALETRMKEQYERIHQLVVDVVKTTAINGTIPPKWNHKAVFRAAKELSKKHHSIYADNSDLSQQAKMSKTREVLKQSGIMLDEKPSSSKMKK